MFSIVLLLCIGGIGVLLVMRCSRRTSSRRDDYSTDTLAGQFPDVPTEEHIENNNGLGHAPSYDVVPPDTIAMVPDNGNHPGRYTTPTRVDSNYEQPGEIESRRKNICAISCRN